ncbi:MAG: hypothetical protein M3Z75_13530 [Actinomycetota bacterium]|nr:hypothetical protein [Actinomycetota bacterium]
MSRPLRCPLPPAARAGRAAVVRVHAVGIPFDDAVERLCDDFLDVDHPYR